MPAFIKKPQDTAAKLAVLSQDSRYDLACACASAPEERRHRSKNNTWIYPVVLPNGGTTYLLKTLLSNACTNDCAYCPLRADSNAERCSLSPEELADEFFAYYRARKVSGLFLTSGVTGSPDATMERINRTAQILRQRQFRGYIHLKIIPGASEGAIRHGLSLASAVSLNIETAGEKNFKHLSLRKDYLKDILRPLQLISRLTSKGSAFEGVKQTTQFVVGASTETDADIIRYSSKLYRELSLNRVYFSAYQRGAGKKDLPGERASVSPGDLLTREHRLYQVDWLMRKYGFRGDEIPLGPDGNLALDVDPKEMWARVHPEFFPVHVNSDGEERLLRVPGLGQTTVDRILNFRRAGRALRSLDDLGCRTKLLLKARSYIAF